MRANIKFSYQDELVEGMITSFNTLLFEVSITIFGFDKTMLGVTSYTLNKDVEFDGTLGYSSGEKKHSNDTGEDDIDSQNAHNDTEIDVDEGDNSDDSDHNNANDNNSDDYEYEDNGHQDYIIRIGRRQYGIIIII